MKTTIDLPDELVKAIKLRAVREGRKFRELMAELLRIGLDGPELRTENAPQSRLKVDKATGLPVIIGGKIPVRPSLTPARVSEILLEQEVEIHQKSS